MNIPASDVRQRLMRRWKMFAPIYLKRAPYRITTTWSWNTRTSRKSVPVQRFVPVGHRKFCLSNGENLLRSVITSGRKMGRKSLLVKPGVTTTSQKQRKNLVAKHAEHMHFEEPTVSPLCTFEIDLSVEYVSYPISSLLHCFCLQ